MPPSSKSPATPNGAASALVFRALARPDLPELDALLRRNAPLFSDRECRMAMSLMEEGLERPQDEDPYKFIVVESGGTILGYVCFGTVPLTDGCFDLYWIALDAAVQGRGIGGLLLRQCEAEIRQQGGRLLVAETSGRAEYAGTRRFYEKAGFEPTARIRDFYRVGDDKCIYVKRLDV